MELLVVVAELEQQGLVLDRLEILLLHPHRKEIMAAMDQLHPKVVVAAEQARLEKMLAQVLVVVVTVQHHLFLGHL